MGLDTSRALCFPTGIMNDLDPIPNRQTRRRRNPGINAPTAVPGTHLGQRQMSPEEWQEHQNKLQAQHARGFVEARDREIAEAKATNKQRRLVSQAGHSIVGGDVMSEAENIQPVPKKATLSKAKQIKVAARGPKVDEENVVVDEGEVPIKHSRSKKISKVAQARKNARLKKVLA